MDPTHAERRRTSVAIVMPCYNEATTIDATVSSLRQLATSLERTGITMTVVAVDDASTDATLAVLRACSTSWPALRIVTHATNAGKGSAVQTARQHVNGDIVVIQDADTEYDPRDIPALLAPIIEGRADAVLGSRFGGAGAARVLYFWHRVGNGWLTLMSNMFTNLNVSDMETGYKAFTREAFTAMHLTNPRFGIEPEMIARLAQMGARVYEVPISYHGRTYAEGKKITWRDGVMAFVHILHAALTRHHQPLLAAPPATPERWYPASSPSAV